MRRKSWSNSKHLHNFGTLTMQETNVTISSISSSYHSDEIVCDGTVSQENIRTLTHVWYAVRPLAQIAHQLTFKRFACVLYLSTCWRQIRAGRWLHTLNQMSFRMLVGFFDTSRCKKCFICQFERKRKKVSKPISLITIMICRFQFINCGIHLIVHCCCFEGKTSSCPFISGLHDRCVFSSLVQGAFLPLIR